ncbi:MULTISPECIES: nuclear transport factor 2 family protein [Frankia]|nr:MULTISPECIES: nuclear transport factor 2 family protein [Frankia]
MPARLEGPEEIRAYFAAAAKAPIRWEKFDDMVVHETADPEVVIVEYNARGKITTTGAAYQQSIIAVFQVHDGKIVLYRDYLNPLALAEARMELSTPAE